MISPQRYKSLLRTVYSGIVGSRLTPTELSALAEELRRGRFPDELAYMLDQVTRHLVVEGDGNDDDNVIEAERLVKLRKVSRSALYNILLSLGGRPAPASSTIRTLLRDFVSEASPTATRKLLEILNSKSDGDSFLAGISSSRK